MVTTYALEDPSSITSVEVYSDAGLTTLVETLSNISSIGTGIRESDDPFTLSLYTYGQTYYVKVVWTPQGSTSRTDSFPILILPQAQALANPATTVTACEDSTHRQAPRLYSRLGLGGHRNTDLSNAQVSEALSRYEQVFPLPDDRAHAVLHFILNTHRAGAPCALQALRVVGSISDAFGNEATGSAPIPMPLLGQGGYRASSAAVMEGSQGTFLLHRSRNIILSETPHTRPGYSIRRQISQSSATYLKRLPVNEADGTFHAAIQLADTIYLDSASPTSIDATLTNPYSAASNKMPQGVFMKGRYIQVGNEFRVLIHDGSTLISRDRMTDPSTLPTPSAVAGGSLTVQTWQMRIRGYDEKTGTYSGPNDRLVSTTLTQTTTGPNATIRLTFSGGWFPSRYTHFQVQLASLDTPDSYEIAYTVKDTGGSTVSDATGHVPVANLTVDIDADPASGDRFEFRTVAGVSVYQHATIPVDAHHITHFRGRAFYASYDARWLIFSETDNPEHGYWDASDPTQGFNTVEGEGFSDVPASPCQALAATEDQLYYFGKQGIVVWFGSFALQIDNNTAEVRGRDAGSVPLTQNTLGAISPDVFSLNTDLYFVSDNGPAVLSAGRVLELDPEGIREDWLCRDPVYEKRTVLGYSPRHHVVVFSYVPQDSAITGTPTVTLAWDVRKQRWCAPWDIAATSWTLHEDQDDSANEKGVRLFAGGPYGSMLEFGVGYGDGWDGSDNDSELTSTADTVTTVTVGGKSWTTDEHRGKSVLLIDRTTGDQVMRWVKTNTADTLTWDGNATDAGGGWLVFLGGIPYSLHVALMTPGRVYQVSSLVGTLQDLLSIHE